ncbi:MAG: YidC/Oxa1 family membrane protein insertase, partial [Chloroflexota bacterium]
LGMDLTAQPQPPSNPWYALALPVLVAATTWLQFKMSMSMRKDDKKEDNIKDTSKDDSSGGMPDQAAAMQQSMGTIMPLMFGFISLTLSVGLSIYFLTSNVVGIIQYSPMGKRVLDKVFRSGGDRKEKDKDDDKPAKKARGKK